MMGDMTLDEDPRTRRIRELQKDGKQRGDDYRWFDAVYVEAEGVAARIPWSETGLNEQVGKWGAGQSGEGQTAVVIGCGLGDNAEFLSLLGFAVTAFDISPAAVAWCRRRFPRSRVRYVEGDLFQAAQQLGVFDFVLEVHTLQALPRELRAQAVAAIAALARRRVLVIGRGCDQPAADEMIPWPLTRGELAGFLAAGLREVYFRDFLDDKQPPVRRFVVEYERAYTET